MNRLSDLFSKRAHGSIRRRQTLAARMHLETLEPRALLAVTLPPDITGDTVEIDDNVVIANGDWSITATGGQTSDGHVQIFGNSRGRIDGTPGDNVENLTIDADTFITVTGAIGATNRVNDLTLTSDTAGPISLQQAVSLTGDLRVTKAGAFAIGSTVDVDGNLVIDAATSVLFSGNVNVDGDLTITNAASVLFAGTLTVGGTLTISNVTGSTRFAGSVSVGAADVTSTTLVQVQANFASTGAAGDGDVTITTDQIGFAAAMLATTAVSAGDPTATLTVKPRTASRDLTIASPPGIPSGVNITDADLFAIQPGWKRVVLGDEAAGTGAVRIGSIGSQYGGFSQILNTTTIVGGTIQVVQPVDVTDLADYLELVARGTGSPGSGSLTINAPINQTAEERNDWVRLTSAGSISLNAPVWSDQTASLTTTTGGTIAQGGSTAAITTLYLAVKADGAVTLADSGNAFNIMAAETSNDDLVVREDSGYSIGRITTNDTARDVPASVTVTGIDTGVATVRLVTIGGQTATSVLQTQPVLAGGLGLEGAGTSWNLPLATNDVATLVGDTDSITFRDADDLTIGTVAAVSPRSSLLGITVTRTLSVVTGTTLTITAAGDIVSKAPAGTAVTLTGPSGISTAGDIVTSGADATFNNATMLTGDVVLDLEDGPARGTVTFASTVQGTASGQESLTIGGNLDARGSIGSTTALESLSVSGTSTLAAGITLRTTGSQTYTGASSSTGAITIQAGSGSTVTFLDAVTLGGLVTAIADTSAYDVTMTGSPVSVTNAVTFANTGTVTLGDASTDSLTFAGGLSSTAPALTKLAGTIGTTNAGATFGTTKLSADTTVATGTGAATFSGTVDGGQSLTVNATGTTTFAAAVGGTTALVSLATNAGGTTAINGGTVTTTGNAGQAFNDAVTLGANTTLAAAAGPISFAGTVDGGRVLVANTSGVTAFGGAVGGTTALVSLTTDAGGSTRINGGTVTTSGADGQVYNDPVIIGATTRLNAAAGAVTLASTVDGAYRLVVNTSGVTNFAGSIGGATPLLSLATDAGGSTRIGGGDVTTSGVGGQVYNDAVILGASTRLGASAGPVTMASTVDGAYRLVVNTSGVSTFRGAVGGVTPLLSLATDAGGRTRIEGGSVTTSGQAGQVYSDAVVLGADATLSAAARPITFAGTLDGAYGLVANTTGITTFGGAVGSLTLLARLSTSVGGETRINGGSVSTAGPQTYGDAVILGVTTTLRGAGITCASTVDGSRDGSGLSIVDSGTTMLDGAVGGVSMLTTFTTDAGGATVVNGGAVAATDRVTFGDAVTLGADSTISGLGIRFASTISGAGRKLSATSGNGIVFDGAVGSEDQPIGQIVAYTFVGDVIVNAAIWSGSTQETVVASVLGAVDGGAGNQIHVPNGRLALAAATGIGQGNAIAVGSRTMVMAVSGSTGISLRGVGDLVIGSVGTSGSVTLDATGRILVPNGGRINGSPVTATKTIEWTVTNADNTGSGSLRQVIDNANATGCTSSLVFPGGASVYTPASPLPEITTRLTIDGGGAVVLDGGRSVANGLVFTAQAAGSVLRGVTLQNFSGFAVQLVGAQNVAVDAIVVQSLNTSASMGLYATGDLTGTVITGSTFSGGLRGALLANARNLAFGQVGRGNLLSNNVAAPSSPAFAGTGIRAQGNCQGTVVTGNTFNRNNYGFAFVNAQNLSLRQNAFTRNTVGIFIQGICTGSTQTGNVFGTGRAANGVNVQRARNAQRT